jgi:hypothetical protein
LRYILRGIGMPDHAASVLGRSAREAGSVSIRLRPVGAEKRQSIEKKLQ